MPGSRGENHAPLRDFIVRRHLPGAVKPTPLDRPSRIRRGYKRLTPVAAAATLGDMATKKRPQPRPVPRARVRVADSPPRDSPAGRLARAYDVDALDALVAIEELRQDLEELEARQLVAAREARRTWAEIGAGVGLSRQAAWKRYGRLVDRLTREGLMEPLEADQGGQERP